MKGVSDAFQRALKAADDDMEEWTKQVPIEPTLFSQASEAVSPIHRRRGKAESYAGEKTSEAPCIKWAPWPEDRKTIFGLFLFMNSFGISYVGT